MLAREDPRPIQLLHERSEEDLLHERGLAGAAHARDAREQPEGQREVHVLQVVLPGSQHLQPPVVRVPADLGSGDHALAGEECAGQGVVVVQQALEVARVHDLAAVVARARPDIYDVVRGPDGGLVVLHDDQRVAQVPEADQRVDQPAVVPLVQADRRLVQDVQDSNEPAPDLGGQADPLGLAPRQRGRRPGQRQVVQAHVHQEPQPGPDLLDQALGDHPLPLGQVDLVEERQRVADRARRELGDVHTSHRHRQALRPKARAAARPARDLSHVLFQPVPLAVGVGLLVPAFDRRDDTLVRGPVRAGPPVAVPVPDVDLLIRAVQHDLAGFLRQLLPGRLGGEAVGLGHRLEHPVPVLEAGPGPRGDPSLFDAELGVGHHELGVDLQAGPSFCEKCCTSSFPSGVCTAMAAIPSASWSAVSIESATRRRMSGLATRRSTTTSIVCL